MQKVLWVMTNQHMPAYQGSEYMEWCVSSLITEEADISGLRDQVHVSYGKLPVNNLTKPVYLTEVKNVFMK
jgi:hypothetical protein